jgi:predicted RNase H-like nuclease (RuvC/YqgF family)
VELGDRKNGIVKRMGFRLDTLDRELAGTQDVLDKLQAREDALREERDRDPGYGDQISDLEAQIEKIDKKLGVKK